MERKQYEEIIGKKLNGATSSKGKGLWTRMEATLDKTMPRPKKKKEGKGWRFSTNAFAAGGLLLVAVVYTVAQCKLG
jgi:hypothetical protein